MNKPYGSSYVFALIIDVSSLERQLYEELAAHPAERHEVKEQMGSQTTHRGGTEFRAHLYQTCTRDYHM
jgi:hypothetical protein